MEIVGIWTGQSANALRMALRMTNEAFARHLGTAVRTVAKWGAQPEVVPVSELQRALDTALARASAEEQARFALLSPGVQSQRPIKADVPQQSILDSAGVEPRLTHDSAINDALHWLDSHMGWPDGEARGRVRSTLRTLNEDAIESLARRRGNVGQTDIARALRAYYDATELTQYRFYEGLCDGARFATSVLLNPEWAGLRITLGRGNDHMALSPNTSTPDRYRLDEHAGDAAIRRLAETLTVGTRLLNAPLYRLLTVDISPNGIRGEVGVTSFVEYALTLDLLEGELVDAISCNHTLDRSALPLRNHYMPDLAALIDLKGRLCVGGPVVLTAIARPPSRWADRPSDYALLVQERSGRVLNAARRLAVIPKAFHQPLVDFSDDAQILATIEREMEEELLGRPELDLTDQARRSADPMHVTRLSEPMRWLIEHDDAQTWRAECVAFGINAMSGNFEYAALIIIDDERWWNLYGGAVEANWEAEGLRTYSSLSRRALAALIRDPAWSNEGLFAFLQGIRRLAQIGDERVALPSVGLEFQ